jgi:hypothetical protein
VLYYEQASRVNSSFRSVEISMLQGFWLSKPFNEFRHFYVSEGENMSELSVTVSGSFHRHISAIMDAVKVFNDLGVRVLSPSDPRVVDSVGQFLFVASDKHRSVRLVQDRHLSAITQSDFLWLVAPDGYIGQSASLELGFAIAYGTPIYCEVLPPDLTLRQYVVQVKDIKEAVRIIKNWQQRERPSTSLLLDPHSTTELAHKKLEIIDQALKHPEKMATKVLEESVSRESKEIGALLAPLSGK